MNNPFYYAKVWRGLGTSINGEIIEIQDYLALLKKGYSLFSFTGRTATVCVISEDRYITRGHALDFATMFMSGKYVTISVNLADLTRTVTNGNPPP